MQLRLALLLAVFGFSSAPALAAIQLSGGDHILWPNSSYTFPIIATSDAGDTLQGLDLFLVIQPSGPVITKVDLITGTVFEPNNFGQQSFGLPEFETPGWQPAYFTGTVSGTVPLGVVALVTIDTTGVALGNYTMSFVNDTPVPSAAYDANGVPHSIFSSVTIGHIPEPGTIGLAAIAAVGLGVLGLKRRRRRDRLVLAA